MTFLPSLKQTPFVSFEANFSLQLQRESKDLRNEKEKHLRGLDSESFAGEDYFLSLDIELRDELLIKLGVESTEFFSEGIADRSDHERLTVSEIEKRFQCLLGKEFKIEAKCGFSVDVNDLPENGVVRRGLGVRAYFREDELCLVGAQFAINDHLDNNTISWFVEPGHPDWSTVFGSIISRTTHVLDSTVFSEIVAQSRQQFERYILEQDLVEYQ